MSAKILVIDNHKETIDLVSTILKREGYRLMMANTATEGIALAGKELPNLIMLDVMMPDMDGLTACRKIRALPGLDQTPIIMFTAKSMPDEKWEGFQAGATDYLVKPTTSEELTKRVRTILGRTGTVSSNPQTISTGPGTRPQIISFVGSRGGVGTTTAAINTAFILSAKLPTTLVDLDMPQGHVSQYLNISSSDGLNHLIEGGIVSMKAQLSNEVVEVSKDLHLLLTLPNETGNVNLAEPHHVPHLADALTNSGRQIIVDAGRGVNDINRPLLERSDHIVVCIQPDRLSLSSAKRMMAFLDEMVLPTTEIHPIMLSFSPALQVAQPAIEKFLGRSLVTMISVTPQQMARAANRGLPLVKSQSDGELPKKFAQIAQAVSDGA